MAIIGVALAQNAQTATKIVLTFDCEASADVGDLVYIDPDNENKVLVNANNTVIQQTIGVITTKPDSTTAKVLILGIASGYSSLTISGKIFLGTDGLITQTLPTSGYRQVLGVAASETEILFIPSNERVLRI